MMQYLNTQNNIAAAPNENYSRECQELFTVGKGPDSKYTQSDVLAAARVLTGWSEDASGFTTVFRPSWHDVDDKKFSAFYDNTVIKGRYGSSGADETRELVEMIFKQGEVAMHFCRCLFRWFVSSIIDSDIESNVIKPLADILISNNYEIKPALRTLLSSELFFDNCNIGSQIKNPVDYLLGTCKQIHVTSFDSDLTKQYFSWQILASQLRGMYMNPGEPPNVAGWPAYYLYPSYDELWISSTTVVARNRAIDSLMSDGISDLGLFLKLDFLSFTREFSDPADIHQFFLDTTRLLCAVPFDPYQTMILKEILSPKEDENAWHKIWADYASNPGDIKIKNIVDSRLRKYYTYILKSSECQLN